MMLPKNIKTQHLARLDELIAEGKQVVDWIREIPPHTRAELTVPGEVIIRARYT